MKDQVCEQCGLIHPNGISWHGHCYNCGGNLIAFNFNDVELTAVTPKGIQIYNRIVSVTPTK
jgi:hypothetical protein